MFFKKIFNSLSFGSVPINFASQSIYMKEQTVDFEKEFIGWGRKVNWGSACCASVRTHLKPR